MTNNFSNAVNLLRKPSIKNSFSNIVLSINFLNNRKLLYE